MPGGPYETGLGVVGTWGLAIGLVQGGLQVLHGVLLDLCPGPLRDPGDMAAEDCLEAWEVHRAFVIQFSPEGAKCEQHIVGLREERLGVGDPHVPEGLTGPGPLPLWLPAWLSIPGRCGGRGGARSP